VFATHDAADGALARVRLPGGRIAAAGLRVLADAADELGDGALHLTSRGNVQLRGLRRGDVRLVRRLSEAGLLPSPRHERVRNFLASPGSERAGRLVGDLDAAVCARPELAELPGRFLFAVDDGRGDVSGRGADVCWRALDATTGALLLDGADTGLRIPVERAVDVLVLAACTFAATRGSAWRVREAPSAAARIVAAAGGPARRAEPVAMPVSLGRAGDVFPLLGTLTAAQARVVAAIAPLAVVTPWRSILLPGAAAGAPGALVRAGLTVDAEAPGTGISACIGLPGCAKSRADVRADAVRVLKAIPSGARAHFAGCERRCGRPSEAHADVVADGGGYLVDGVWVSSSDVSEALQEKGNW
jgi:precorrin-3B synthase